MQEKVLFSWSGGKDSAMALYEVLRDDRYEVTALLTTLSAEYQRVSNHGVREEVLDAQARSLRLPLEKLLIPGTCDAPCSNEQYEALMGEVLRRHRDAGVASVVHGDLFLEDLRAYREQKLATIGLKGLFPVWGRETRQFVRDFVSLGFKARITCVDGNALGEEFVGRDVDELLLSDLPADVDACGENGEYHSLVYDGPIFHEPLRLLIGKRISSHNRHYVDLHLVQSFNQAPPEVGQ